MRTGSVNEYSGICLIQHVPGNDWEVIPIDAEDQTSRCFPKFADALKEACAVHYWAVMRDVIKRWFAVNRDHNGGVIQKDFDSALRYVRERNEEGNPTNDV